ncbi:hypothetical protein D3C84_989750 [compost metagenome]
MQEKAAGIDILRFIQYMKYKYRAINLHVHHLALNFIEMHLKGHDTIMVNRLYKLSHLLFSHGLLCAGCFFACLYFIRCFVSR